MFRSADTTPADDGPNTVSVGGVHHVLIRRWHDVHARDVRPHAVRNPVQRYQRKLLDEQYRVWRRRDNYPPL